MGKIITLLEEQFMKKNALLTVLFLAFSVCQTSHATQGALFSEIKQFLSTSALETGNTILYYNTFDLPGDDDHLESGSLVSGYVPISCYRKYLGKSEDNYYIVQDFYVENDNKRSSPFKIKEKEDVRRPEPKSIEGPLVYWYENGPKKLEGNYINGLPNGVFHQWYENGQKRSEGKHKDGQVNGLTTFWRANGNKYQEGKFINSLMDGVWTVWYPTGEKEVEAKYTNGVAEGLITRWYPNGKKLLQGNMIKGKNDGLWFFWHENGKKREEGHYQNGAKNGVWVAWHENGKKSEEGHYKNGAQNGLWIFWNGNGDKYFEGNYVNGNLVIAPLKEGNIIAYFDERGYQLTNSKEAYYYRKYLGKNNKGHYLIEDFFIKNNQKQMDITAISQENSLYSWNLGSAIEGKLINWHDNGQKASEGEYVDGLKDGVWISWHDNGQKASEGKYVEGFREGLWNYWDENGNLEN